MEKIIVIVAFFFVYFHISGLATTNILRLTRGNELPILASKCVCANCGAPITPFHQLPIISYIVCGGKCRMCKSKIPIDGLILEIVVLIGMFLLSFFWNFSFLGVTISFVYYEIVRVFVVVNKGKRASLFAKQYLIAMMAMIPFYLMTLFVSLIYTAVSIS